MVESVLVGKDIGDYHGLGFVHFHDSSEPIRYSEESPICITHDLLAIDLETESVVEIMVEVTILNKGREVLISFHRHVD